MRLFVILFVSLLFALPAHSQSRGRTADGKAYRTDAAGNQIVDYIAELEVTNEALERRISGLLGEVEELRSSGASTARFTERELLSDAPLSNTANTPPANRKMAPLAASTCGERECEVFISEVAARGKRSLTVQGVQLEELKNAKAACDQQMEQARAQKQTCDQQFGAFRTAMDLHEAEEVDLKKELAGEKFRVSSLEDSLNTKISEVQTVRGDLEKSKQQLAEFIRTNDELSRKLGSAQRIAAKESQRAQTVAATSATSTTSSPAPSSSSAATRASMNVGAATVPSQGMPGISSERRNRVRKLYESVIKARNKRDQIFRSYNNSKLAISKTSIRTTKGKMPEQLLGLVKSTESSRQLSMLEKEGHRLERLVMRDIALIKRLKNR